MEKKKRTKYTNKLMNDSNFKDMSLKKVLKHIFVRKLLQD